MASMKKFLTKGLQDNQEMKIDTVIEQSPFSKVSDCLINA